MTAVVRSELYRLATIRSSALSLAIFTCLGTILGMIGSDFWALLAGVGAFGFGSSGSPSTFSTVPPYSSVWPGPDGSGSCSRSWSPP